MSMSIEAPDLLCIGLEWHSGLTLVSGCSFGAGVTQSNRFNQFLRSEFPLRGRNGYR